MSAQKEVESGVRLSDREMQTISRVLADPRRFNIFRKIAAYQSVACSDLRQCLPITPATLSHHLKELEAAGLIDVTRCGKFMNASINRRTWQAYLAELNNI